MENHLYRNIVALMMAISISLILLVGCGCVSYTDSTGSSEPPITIETITTEAYNQSGGTSAQANKEITASDSDKSSIKVTDGGILSLSDSTIIKTGDASSTENSDFYGNNAAVLAEADSIIKLTNCNISTSANAANAVFATGQGASIVLSSVKIRTTGDGSRGVDATFTGNISCTDVNISTEGQHCAAIATDRGSGTVTVMGGSMNTAGSGSPGIYSTGDITVSNSIITATGSEAAVIEGKNSITLYNVTLSGAKKCGAMLYQSFSGDAEVGTSIFTMNGGSLAASVGPLFYITNTDSIIELNGSGLTASSGILLTARTDSWGNTGSNGGVVTLKAEDQVLNGDITCDNLSSVTVILEKNTTLTGAVNSDNTAGSMTLTLNSTGSWDVTGNSYLTILSDEDFTLSNIKDNGYTIYYDADNSKNSWLDGETYTLTDGGKLTPITASV